MNRDEPVIHAVVSTGGHPFEHEQFLDVFLSMPDVTVEHVEQPESLDRIRPGRLSADVVVFYDMPGLRFTGSAPPVEFIEPPVGYVDGLVEIARSGVGLVFMHHAIASWPTRDDFAELVGGRFHYQPGTLDGRDYPDSGYRFDVTHTVEVLDPDHPIVDGLPPTFRLTDELYCFPVLEATVTPLMRTTFAMEADRFFSADAAIRGRRNDRAAWTHPDGSSLVAWTRDLEPGRVAYLQFGDGPQTYADPTFRRILRNALGWAAG